MGKIYQDFKNYNGTSVNQNANRLRKQLLSFRFRAQRL